MNTTKCRLNRSSRLSLAAVLLATGIASAAGGGNDPRHGQVRVESQAELDRMEAHLRSLYDRGNVRHSFKQPSGDDIDCVDIDKQPALRRPDMRGHVILTPPAVASEPGDVPAESADGPKLAELEPLTGEPDENGAERKCPSGTIPIRRTTLDDMKRFRKLEDFLRKYPDDDAPPASGPTNLHQYAHAYRFVSNYGAHSTFNLWNPKVQAGANEFSLSQLWVTRGSGSYLETLEAGIQVFPNKYGDGKARLFIYSTSDGYSGNSYASGCYNLDCSRFVQTNSSVIIGGSFSVYSVTSGTQQEVDISFVRGGSPTPAWWLNVNGVWVGYYPLNLFDSYGVKYSASEIDFGGEIIDDRTTHSYHTTTDMGSSTGAYPSAGYGQAAYQRRLFYYTTPGTTAAATGLSAVRTNPLCYDIVGPYSDVYAGIYFYFGGPGYNVTCQ